MKVVCLGATKGMGRSLARLMAARGDELFLLGRNPEDLQKCADDLGIRGASGEVYYGLCDLKHPHTFCEALDAAKRQLGGLDVVVLTAGVYATQEVLETDAATRDELLTVDFTNTIEFCEQARIRLLQGRGGVLCVFSSVAGDRARKSRIFYGAAKAGLSYYLDGLDLKYHARGLRTINVKPGFVRTSMTAGLPEPPFASDPEDAARAVLRTIDRPRPVVYVPFVWHLVMLVIGLLPRWVMRRMDF